MIAVFEAKVKANTEDLIINIVVQQFCHIQDMGSIGIHIGVLVQRPQLGDERLGALGGKVFDALP